jgi:hypothetical protein
VPAQGQSSFVWNVLTAVGERTTGDLGPGVTCPSFRFHPAVVAQASATLVAATGLPPEKRFPSSGKSSAHSTSHGLYG